MLEGRGEVERGVRGCRGSCALAGLWAGGQEGRLPRPGSKHNTLTKHGANSSHSSPAAHILTLAVAGTEQPGAWEAMVCKDDEVRLARMQPGREGGVLDERGRERRIWGQRLRWWWGGDEAVE